MGPDGPTIPGSRVVACRLRVHPPILGWGEKGSKVLKKLISNPFLYAGIALFVSNYFLVVFLELGEVASKVGAAMATVAVLIYIGRKTDWLEIPKKNDEPEDYNGEEPSIVSNIIERLVEEKKELSNQRKWYERLAYTSLFFFIISGLLALVTGIFVPLIVSVISLFLFGVLSDRTSKRSWYVSMAIEKMEEY